MSHKNIYFTLVKMMVPSVKLGAMIEKLHCSVEPRGKSNFADYCVCMAGENENLCKVRVTAEKAWVEWHG